MSQKLKKSLLVLSTVSILALLAVSTVTAFAQPACGPQNVGLPGCPAPTSSTSNCDGRTEAGLQDCLEQSQIVRDIQIVVNFLSAGVGVVVVAMIILGGVQYAMAGDNPQAVSAAKQRITNGLVALLAFLLTFAFLQWLIPGGIFSR